MGKQFIRTARRKAAYGRRKYEAAAAAAARVSAVTTRRQNWKRQDRKSRSRIDGSGPAERKRGTGVHRRGGKVIVLRRTGMILEYEEGIPFAFGRPNAVV